MGRIYIELKGGFGNQLFQAALGVALSRRIGADVAYLADSFGRDVFQRTLLVNRFAGLPLPIVERAEAAGTPVVESLSLEGDPERLLAALEGQASAVLSGWWQREGFFFGEHEAIRRAFVLQPDERLARMGDRVAAADCIGVHVRRTEYGNFGLVKAAYYRDAIAAIRAELGHRPVVFFTDEPNFCYAMFGSIPDMHLYTGDTANPLADFYLLGRCSHFVIANSSFSWWAAWLARRPDSIIYAPEPWTLYSPHGPALAEWRLVPDALIAP